SQASEAQREHAGNIRTSRSRPIATMTRSGRNRWRPQLDREAPPGFHRYNARKAPRPRENPLLTHAVTAPDPARSVIAAPPLAPFTDLKLDPAATADLWRAVCLPLENLRAALSPLRVLRAAAALARVAGMEPLRLQLSNSGVEHQGAIPGTGHARLAHDRALAAAAATGAA